MREWEAAREREARGGARAMGLRRGFCCECLAARGSSVQTAGNRHP